MPPRNVTQRAAPQEVAKQRMWASVATSGAHSGRDPKTSRANTKPTARKAMTVRNRADNAIGKGESKGLGFEN